LTGVIVARIFISYATPDRTIADEVATWLRAEDHDPFLDHDLRDGIGAGEDWKQRLYDELREVDTVIGVVTSSFLTWITTPTPSKPATECFKRCGGWMTGAVPGGRAIIPSLDWSRSPQRAPGCFSVARRKPVR
jgi:hypothetical protein